MTAPSSVSTGETVLGPFEVVADPARIAAFAAATGAAGNDAPAAFPIVWLSEPALQAALRAAVGPEAVPLHESQSIELAAPIAPGATYRLSGVARRLAAPDRLEVLTRAETADGATAVAMRSLLRIVAATEGRAA